MEIYLIRHTAPEIEQGVCYGHADVALKNSFIEEAEIVLQKISKPPSVIFTSPLSRCHRLATLLADTFEIPVIADQRLKELNFGEWELKRWNEIDPLQLERWMNNYTDVACTGGESYIDLYRRSVAFWEDLRKTPYQSAVVVTHHGVLKSIHAHVHNFSLAGSMAVRFDYGSVTVLKSENSGGRS